MPKKIDIIHQILVKTRYTKTFQLNKTSYIIDIMIQICPKNQYRASRGKKVNIKKEFGEKIKKMRKRRNLTQEQLAEMIDISPRNLSGIEVGANFVKAETLEKILIALNTTTEELFSNSEIKENKELISGIIKDVKSIKNDNLKLRRVYKMIKFFVNE